MATAHAATGADRRGLIVPTLLLLVGGIAYGGMFSANKLAASAAFPSFAYTFWVALFGGLALLVVGFVRADLPKLSRAHLLQYLRLAVLAVVTPVLVLAIAAHELPAGVITLVLALVPGMTYGMSFVVRVERFKWLSLLGLVFGAAGVLLIVLPEQSLPDPGAWPWVLFALVAAAAAAMSNVTAAIFRPANASSASLACGILLTAALGMLPVMVLTDGIYLFYEAGWEGMGGMAWAALNHAITFYCFQEVVRRAGPVFFAQFNYLVVAAGLIWAFLLFDESLSIWVWGALGCMGVGVALVNAGAGDDAGANRPGRGIVGALTASGSLWPAALLVLSGATWGLMYSLNQFAVGDGIPFVAYVFWMGTGAALILLATGAVIGGLPTLAWAHVRGYLALGSLSFGLSYTILAFVAPKVPAGVLGLGATLTPILTYPAAAALGMDRFRAVRTLGLVTGVAGVALVLVPETSLPTREMVPWVLLGLAVPLLYVANAIIIALIAPPPSGSLPLAGGALGAGALFMLAVMALTDQWWWFEGPMTDGDWALIVAAPTIALAFYLMIEIIRIAGPVFFTSVNFMIPLTGIGWGMLFFGERHSVWIWVALGLMLSGVFLVNRPASRPAEAEARTRPGGPETT